MIDLDTRRSYFDDYVDTIEEPPPSLVEYGVRYTCSRCGYPTLRARGLDETCYLCSGNDEPEEQRLRREVTAAFDEMQVTPMADHERLWSAVLTASRALTAIR